MKTHKAGRKGGEFFKRLSEKGTIEDPINSSTEAGAARRDHKLKLKEGEPRKKVDPPKSP